MTPFDMKGAWGPIAAIAFDTMIAHGMGEVHERIAGALAERLASNGRYLDVGCGSGRTIAAAARRVPAARWVGVDLSETMVRLARRRAIPAGSARFERGDAMRLGFGDAAFDGAFSVASIKHWPDAERGVREMARVVRPGGRVLVIEADRECTREAADRFVALWRGAFGPVRWIASYWFRRVVAGQALDAARLRRIFEAVDLAEIEVARDPEMPAVYATGVRVVR